jgi:hypothetical protein
MESQTQEVASRRRRSIRRAVAVEAQVTSAAWTDSVALTVTDLSPDGLWLESDLILSVGDELSLQFAPPRWEGSPMLRVRAHVARVSLLRRDGASGRSAGMGVQFTELAPAIAQQLEDALRGLPPPLPARALQLADASDCSLWLQDEDDDEAAPAHCVMTAIFDQSR